MSSSTREINDNRHVEVRGYDGWIEPFVNFHGRVLNTFSSLPKDGAVKEMALRIGTVAIAPLAYLVLGILALSGKGLNRIFNVEKSTENERLIHFSLMVYNFKTDIESSLSSFILPVREIDRFEIFCRVEDNNNSSNNSKGFHFEFKRDSNGSFVSLWSSIHQVSLALEKEIKKMYASTEEENMKIVWEAHYLDDEKFAVMKGERGVSGNNNGSTRCNHFKSFKGTEADRLVQADRLIRDRQAQAKESFLIS